MAGERWYCEDCPEQTEFTRLVDYTVTHRETIDPYGTIIDSFDEGLDPDSARSIYATCDNCDEEVKYGVPPSTLELLAREAAEE